MEPFSFRTRPFFGCSLLFQLPSGSVPCRAPPWAYTPTHPSPVAVCMPSQDVYFAQGSPITVGAQLHLPCAVGVLNIRRNPPRHRSNLHMACSGMRCPTGSPSPAPWCPNLHALLLQRVPYRHVKCGKSFQAPPGPNDLMEDGAQKRRSAHRPEARTLACTEQKRPPQVGLTRERAPRRTGQGTRGYWHRRRGPLRPGRPKGGANKGLQQTNGCRQTACGLRERGVSHRSWAGCWF